MESTTIMETGFWVSIPCLGAVWLWTLDAGLRLRLATRPVAWLGLAAAVGVVLWSLPILWLAETGRHSALGLGAWGWAVVAATLAAGAIRFRRRRLATDSRSVGGVFLVAPRLGAAARELTLLTLLVAAFVLTWTAPSQTILGGRDEGIYANTGAHLAQTGSLQVAYPWRATTEVVSGLLTYPGFYSQPTHFEPQFSHLFPTWLALAHALGGLDGLLRLNALFGVLAALCFYLLTRSFTSEPVALGALAVFVANPAQVFIQRVTLSEVLAQLFTLAAVLLLVWALRARSLCLARWAGFVGGLVGLVRIDGLLMGALVAGGLIVARCLGTRSAATQDAVWRAALQTLVPTMGAVLASYALFSPTYLADLAPPTIWIGVGTCAAFFVAVALVPRPWQRGLPQRTRISRTLALAAIVALLGGSAWGYWMRPGAIVPSVGDLAFVNLGAYLTPAVLVAALLGAAVALWRLLRHGRGRLLLPCLVVFGGYSALYLYDPMVALAHPWAVRRFVPAIVPGFLFFAALALHRLLAAVRGLAGGVSKAKATAVATTLATALVLGSFWQNAGHIYRTQENPTTLEQLRRASRALPPDELVMVPVHGVGWRLWAPPLRLAFGHRLVPLNPASRGGREGLAGWWRRRHERGHPVWILHSGPHWPEAWPAADAVETFHFERRMWQNVPRALPQKLDTTRMDVTLYRSDPPG